MPLTKFQHGVARLLSSNRSEESHLAGGAALHIAPNSKRFSNDLDYFHDSPERVGAAFSVDEQALNDAGYSVSIIMNQPGYIRAVVSKDADSTKVDWAHDSAWRFLPTVTDPEVGYKLHPIDLAINKILALAGRDEPRDFLDIMFAHDNILSLGALCWAAVGKDPGFTPQSLLQLIRRRGKYRPEDFDRLNLSEKVDLQELKRCWLKALDEAESLITRLPPDDFGCLFYSKSKKSFVTPQPPAFGKDMDIVPHFGRPGGVLPNLLP